MESTLSVEPATSVAISSAGEKQQQQQQQQQRRRTRCEPQSQQPTKTDDTHNNDNSMNSSSILEAEESLTNTTTSKRQRIKSPITTTKTTNTDRDDNDDDDIVVPAGGFATELATRVRSNNDAMITSHSSSSVSPRQPIPNAMTNSTEVTPTTTSSSIPDCSIVCSQGRLLTTAFSSHRKTAGRQLPRNNGEGIDPTVDIAQDQQKYNNISTKQTSAKSCDALVEDNKHDKTITVIALSRGDSTNIGATITPPTIDDVYEHDDKSEEDTISIGCSSSSSSNNDDSSKESEEESNNADHHHHHHHHHRRQQQLSKLLRGIEGSAYANTFIRWEEMVNANLSLLKEEETNNSIIPNEASEVTMSDASTTPPTSSSAVVLSEPRFHIADCSSMPPHRLTVRDVILEEYYHTLPASFSLLLHCTLYVVIYSLIAMIVEWVCKDIDMYYFAVMLLSLCMSRMTGNIYNWNDTSIYQKRLDFQLMNKWNLRLWDVKLRNFFEGDAIRSRYKKCVGRRGDSCSTSSSPCEGRSKNIWGRRIKLVLDCCSFFLCYKSVEHFVGRIAPIPSLLLPSTLVGGGESSSVVHQRRVSHACPSVMSALDNPYALDILKSIAKVEVQTEEMKGWITNAKNCGWSSTSGGTKKLNNLHIGDKVEGNWHMEGVYYPGTIVEIINDGHSAIVRYDDNGSFETLSSDNVRHASEKYAKYIDQAKELMFLVTVTALCLGLLYAYDVPFLLI